MKKLVIVWRGFDWLFRKDWYSLYRWKNIQDVGEHRFKAIDIGMFSIILRLK